MVDGRTADVSVGGDDSADVTYTNTYDDAQALAQGELDASVQFMRGRTKMAGDMGTVLALMPVTRSDGVPRAPRARLGVAAYDCGTTRSSPSCSGASVSWKVCVPGSVSTSVVSSPGSRRPVSKRGRPP